MRKKDEVIEKVDHDLQLDEELKLHRRGWVIQRVGWVIMFLIIIMAALGAFGEGILSEKKVKQGNINIEYQKFFRYETEMKILLESPQHISSLSFPQEYLKEFRMLRIEPEPDNNSTINSEVVYNFLPSNNRIVTVYLIPKNYGSIKGYIKVNGGATTELNHFIYP
jgi:hypothetical protein